MRARPVIFIGVLLCGSTCCGAGAMAAERFPSRPIRIVTAEAGGGVDLASRLVAQELAANFGQPVIVDNRGGNAIIPGELVAKAQPDGHTLLFYSSTIWLLQYLQTNVPWDPLRDFAPVTLAISSPNVVVVPTSSPANSIRELIALAKQKPGELNFGTSGTGSSSHLAAELLKAMAGINIVRVAYKGLGPAMNDLISGQLQLMIPGASTAMPHVKSGRLKGLAVTSAQPSLLAPGLPTVAASGLPGYESASINAFFAPGKTPPPIVMRLNQEIVRALQKPEIKARLFALGIDTIGNSPQELAAVMKSNMAQMGKVIMDAGIRAK